MKICYLANAGSIHTYKWVAYFTKKGHQVYLISLKPPKFDYGRTKIFLIKKIKFGPKITSHFINFLPSFFQIKKVLKKINPDVLHIISVAGEGWLGALTGFHPLIITAGGTDVLTTPKESKIYEILDKYALKKADLITCDGENTKEAMVNLGFDSKKIKIIYFGIDFKKFKPAIKNEDLKKELFSEGEKIILSTKPLRRESDIETLIKAVPLILKKASETKFLIAGDGEQEEYLMNLSKSLKVSEKIKFLGWISNDELPLYLNLADVFVSTSLVDGGLAVSTAEAMACGLPVVITDVGDNKKWVEDGKNGFVIPIKNPKVLADKIIYLLRNKEIRRKFGEINQRIIKEKYEYYKEMDKIENIYKEFKKR